MDSYGFLQIHMDSYGFVWIAFRARVKGTHAKGTFQMQSARDADQCWDQELFVKQMELLRGSKAHTSMSAWNRLKLLPETRRDENGPAHCPLRLSIPASLVGKSEFVSEFGVTEEQKLTMASNGSKMNDVQRQTIAAELGKVFSASCGLKVDFSASSMQSRLSAGAFTAEGGRDSAGRDFIGDLVTMVNGSDVASNVGSEDSDVGDCETIGKKMDNKPVDLALIRFKAREVARA